VSEAVDCFYGILKINNFFLAFIEQIFYVGTKAKDFKNSSYYNYHEVGTIYISPTSNMWVSK
jgi:hypothetical protein